MTTAVPLMTEMDKSSENVAASAPQVSQFSYGTVGGNAGPVAGAPANPYSGSGASLYVGDLHPDTNEAALFEHFSQIGPVASIRVCRDAVTRRSLGYAYVNYHNGMDADRALDVLNYSPIRGRPCRLMKSQRDPSLRKSGSGNVFIKNLDKSVDNKALHDTFSAFGNVLSCKVVLDPHGQSKGFAFVHFETQEAADKAIARINGKLLNGKVVFAGRYQSRKERQSKSDEIKTIYTNVFVKNLDPSMNNDEFAQLVSAFGKVTSAVIQTDENGASKGFGFVNYESHSDADVAVQGLNGKTVNGREIFAARAQLKAERVEELKKTFEKLREERLSRFTNLYVKNLADEIDEEKLKAEFAPYGEISSCVIMRDEKGDSRGFGFVSFENLTDASKAINEMNGKLLFTKPLYVAVAQRKEERRAQLEAQHAQRMMRHYAAPMFYPGAMSRPGFAYPPVQGMVPRQPRVIPQQQNGINAPGYPPQVMAPGATNVPTGIRQYRSIRNQQSSDSQSSGGYTRNVPRSSVQQSSGGPRYGGQKNHPGRPAHDQGPGINAAALAAASPEEQKQMLGERLYVLIKGRQPELAGKITGMLLEMDNGEILHLLESPETLNAKIDEALEVINFHAQQQQQQSQ